ncbi:lantibiotic dehydratase C-terminal domain-containing protein [Actinokineospora guangxiensis]|uniref:Lantibiotic dehydratase C-terminal domain-containing protein n=1 Tax=Actinokineospora guangxiensis TaxID=1490288 RepID=A0ABW0EWZ7_9PSEU
MTTDAPRPRTWSAVRCELAWRTEDIDRFIVHRAAPHFDGLRREGHLADWYFERTGTGLVFGLRGADWCTVKALRPDLARLVVQTRRTGAAALADIGETGHTADPERFGPSEAAGDLFCRGTELAVSALTAPGARFTTATELIMATAHALRLDRRATAAWLGGAPSAGAQPLDVRWTRLARTRDHTLVRWTNAVRRARRATEGQAETPPTAEQLSVWREHLHLLLNRLGLTPAETRALCARTASSLSAADPFAADPAHITLANTA